MISILRRIEVSIKLRRISSAAKNIYNFASVDPNNLSKVAPHHVMNMGNQ